MPCHAKINSVLSENGEGLSRRGRSKFWSPLFLFSKIWYLKVRYGRFKGKNRGIGKKAPAFAGLSLTLRRKKRK